MGAQPLKKSCRMAQPRTTKPLQPRALRFVTRPVLEALNASLIRLKKWQHGKIFAMTEQNLSRKSVFDLMTIRSNGKGGFNYVMKETISYYSERYKRSVVAKAGDDFDGATGAMDIDSRSWIFHDVLCRDGCFSDGTPCNNWQASQVLSDVLKEEGRWFRQYTWLLATWLFGGGKARKNGMF